MAWIDSEEPRRPSDLGSIPDKVAFDGRSDMVFLNEALVYYIR